MEFKAIRKLLELKIRMKSITMLNLIYDRDVTLAFREYLYSIYADEFFSFWIAAGNKIKYFNFFFIFINFILK